MKTMSYLKYGPPEVLQLMECEKPVPANHEVLIKVMATTVTSADCMMRRGDTLLSRILLGFTKPKKKYRILGTEFSGIVEAVGQNAKMFSPGDEVFAFRGFGTGCYAQYKCMSENGSVALKPRNMDFCEAASIVDGASTALFFLRKAGVQKGQKVLINGASGSIGTFAVQLAKHFGAEVTGVCGTRNLKMVSLLGADKTVDYTYEDFTKSGETYDIIFDTVGKSSFARCRKALKPGGQYLVTVMTLTNVLLSLLTRIGNGKRVIFAMSVNKTAALKFIRTLVEEGRLVTLIDRQYSLEEIQEAHAYVEEGHKQGNVTVSVTH